ncbi:hypothetical protein V5N11_011145 [Cardamine amara subsp. amara]|uniref:DEK-C domain-containing protein n=1 Tax=Cardamine amara subsp. amara TaxID=228776 RepID=A0ABD0ZY54_CARAN
MSGDSAVTAMDTAETAEKTHTPDKVDSKEIKLQILAAMRSRATYLRDKADLVTLESVRRLLEEDMGLEKYALDVHKSFVKEHLVQCIEDAGNVDITESERKDNDAAEEHEAKNDETCPTCDDEKDKRNKEELMSDIKSALRKRSSFIKANLEEITLAELRRLLEEDLELEKHSLDLYKKFINEELDDVLQVDDAPKRTTKSTGKNVKTKVKSTPSKKVDSEENSDSDAEGDVDDEEEVGVKKKVARKRKLSKSETTGKQKGESGKSVSGKKKAKHAETDSENDSDHEMVDKKPLKRQTKETTPTVYGKRVEHLKSVIKSCGMSVPPSIYKKAKQAPEEKREATLIEELEQILAKEGLSSDPSEKEIKEVKKRKTISKELEGIDTSNIVSSSRRRSTTSFVPPPKPKITVESESESESESDEPEDSENEEDNKEEEEEGNEEPEKGSQSEEESNNEDDGGEESE